MKKRKINTSYLEKYIPWLIIISIAFSIISLKSNIRNAYEDIIYKKGQEYKKQINERSFLMQTKNINSFSKLNNIPTTIFFADITEDEKHWKNQCFAEYYELKEVKIK